MKWKVTVCSGPECGDKRDSRSLWDALVAALQERGIAGQVTMSWQACFGRCFHGPNIYVRPERTGSLSLFDDSLAAPGPGAALYVGLTVADIGTIVEEHLVQGRIIKALRYKGN
jgi:(2Fe-2S) ferredoxin